MGLKPALFVLATAAGYVAAAPLDAAGATRLMHASTCKAVTPSPPGTDVLVTSDGRGGLQSNGGSWVCPILADSSIATDAQIVGVRVDVVNDVSATASAQACTLSRDFSAAACGSPSVASGAGHVAPTPDLSALQHDTLGGEYAFVYVTIEDPTDGHLVGLTVTEGGGCATGATVITLPGLGNSGSFGTTGPVCVRYAGSVRGWNASNVEGRSVTAVGSTGQSPTVQGNGLANEPGLSPGPDGFVYWNFTGGAGDVAFASMATF